MISEEEEYAAAVAAVMALDREQYFGLDILRRIDQAVIALFYAEQDPLVWRDSGIGITVSDVLHDAYVAIRRLRNELPPKGSVGLSEFLEKLTPLPEE